MDCLTDYIGISGCRGSIPESGLYVNELPGISLQSIDKIADSEQQTYKNVWADVQKRAIRKLSADVTGAFGKRYKIKTLTDSVQLPRIVDTSDITAMSEELRGIPIELSHKDSDFLPSGLQVIHIQKLEGYFNGAQDDLPFKVIDLDTNEVIDEFTKTVAVGWNTIATNKDYAASRIFIGYDATAVGSVLLELKDSNNCSCQFTGCQATIKGGQYDETTHELTEGTNTFGLSAIIGVQCRYDAVVCNNKSVFANALWYLLGSELMQERIYSDRINRYTTVDIKKAAEMRKEFREQYVIELESAIDGINLNHQDCCLECAAQLEYVEATL